MRLEAKVAAWHYCAKAVAVAAGSFAWHLWHVKLTFPFGGGESHYLFRTVVPLGFFDGFRLGALAVVATTSFAAVLRYRTVSVTALMAMAAAVSALGWETPAGTTPVTWWERAGLAVPFMLAAAGALSLEVPLGWFGITVVATLPLAGRLTEYLSYPSFGFRVGMAMMSGVAVLLSIGVARWRLDDPGGRRERSESIEPVPEP